MNKKGEYFEFVLGKYVLGDKVRTTKYCEVYYARSSNGEHESTVEAKIIELSKGFNVKMLEYEVRVRREIFKNDYLFKFIEDGTVMDVYYALTEPKAGTLEELISVAGSFSMQTVILTVYELICVLEKVHKEKFLVRSISPDNIAVGLGDRAKNFYIVDCFAFKKFWDSRTGKHIPCIEGKPLVREPLYASSHEHLGIEASRRDDLESLAYVALFMFVGRLPWHEDVAKDSAKENYPIIMSKKLNITPESLFVGFPYQFAILLKYAKGLKFDEMPDYEWLKGLFSDLFNSLNYKVSQALDWIAETTKQYDDGDEEEDDAPANNL